MLKLILYIVIVILVISYFGLDLRKIVESEKTKENFTYAKEKVVFIWNKIFPKIKDGVEEMDRNITSTSTISTTTINK